MKGAQMKRLKAYRKYETKLPLIENAHNNEMVVRNDWKEYIAHNESDVCEPEILFRVDEYQTLYEDEETPLDEAYGIVLVSSDQAVNEGAEVAWVKTGVNIAKIGHEANQIHHPVLPK